MNQKHSMTFIAVVVILILGSIVLVMWGMPQYRVYQLELSGKAQLKEAEWNRQIHIEEARAEHKDLMSMESP